MIKTNIEYDKQGVWNVVVGSDFGSYISYEKSYLLFFRIKEIHFLIFRFGFDESMLAVNPAKQQKEN